MLTSSPIVSSSKTSAPLTSNINNISSKSRKNSRKKSPKRDSSPKNSKDKPRQQHTSNKMIKNSNIPPHQEIGEPLAENFSVASNTDITNKDQTLSGHQSAITNPAQPSFVNHSKVSKQSSADAAVTQKNGSNSSQAPSESFFGMLYEIPVINSTVTSIKRVIPETRLTSMVSSMATKISLIADSNIPSNGAIRKSLSALDNQACQSLKNMENKYPIIKKPTDELIENVKNSVTDIEKMYNPIHSFGQKGQKDNQDSSQKPEEANKRNPKPTSAEPSPDQGSSEPKNGFISFIFSNVVYPIISASKSAAVGAYHGVQKDGFKKYSAEQVSKSKIAAREYLVSAKAKATEKVHSETSYASNKMLEIKTILSNKINQITDALTSALHSIRVRATVTPYNPISPLKFSETTKKLRDSVNPYFISFKSSAFDKFVLVNDQYSIVSRAQGLNTRYESFLPPFIHSYFSQKLASLDSAISKKEK
ncbi:hypothetical protein BB560_003945 [Smittium megazygosporum]|uniref:Uncharacterized protein n=1 Tax=Smittium megazygosporum TaxID=133381 RepID=A0A2T9ZAQ5_9FUNG|nr:hypothetical protein BB560_003945 [Smittium megazygosporum]